MFLIACLILLISVLYLFRKEPLKAITVPFPPEISQNWSSQISTDHSIKDGLLIKCYDPSTGYSLGSATPATPKEMKETVDRARTAQKSYQHSSFELRKQMLGSLLNSLTTPAVRHGFSGSVVSERRLRLLADVTSSAGQFLDHCNVHSFMSKKPQASFFRTLVEGFPEVLDIMCCLDDVSLPDINTLRKGLAFLARATEQISKSQSPPLYATIRECDLGAIVAFLVTTASEYERKALGEVLAGLLKGYKPVSFRESSLTPRVMKFLRPRSGGSSRSTDATKLEVGVRVQHPTRGAGQVVDYDYDDERGKPYVVMYETGGEHHCNPRSVPLCASLLQSPSPACGAQCCLVVPVVPQIRPSPRRNSLS